MDVAAAAKGPLKNLLSGKRKDYEPSSSALIFYWGINREFTSFPNENSRKSCRTFRAKADIVDMRSLNVLTWVTPVHR